MPFKTILAGLCILLMCCAASEAQTKKYDIKSGIVTFEEAGTVMRMTIKKTIVLTFDDYGMKERKETFKKDVLEEVNMSDGRTIYLLKPQNKTAYKRGAAFRGTEVKFDWNEVPEKDKQQGKATQLPARSIAGRDCEAFQHILGSTTSIFAGWKGITLSKEVKGPSMTVTTKAVSIRENVPLPASTFEIPVGYTVQ